MAVIMIDVVVADGCLTIIGAPPPLYFRRINKLSIHRLVFQLSLLWLTLTFLKFSSSSSVIQSFIHSLQCSSPSAFLNSPSLTIQLGRLVRHGCRMLRVGLVCADHRRPLFKLSVSTYIRTYVHSQHSERYSDGWLLHLRLLYDVATRLLSLLHVYSLFWIKLQFTVHIRWYPHTHTRIFWAGALHCLTWTYSNDRPRHEVGLIDHRASVQSLLNLFMALRTFYLYFFMYKIPHGITITAGNGKIIIIIIVVDDLYKKRRRKTENSLMKWMHSSISPPFYFKEYLKNRTNQR